MRTRRAAPEVERTKPGSENAFRVTYSDYKRWTNDRPGDGVDPDREKKLKDLFGRGDVKRSLKKLEKATETYVKSGDKKPLGEAADAMRLDNGVEVSMDVLRHVHKVEKAQLDKQESDSQKKVVEALDMAKKRIKNASHNAMMSRVAKRIVADYGEVELVMNIDEVFDYPAGVSDEIVSVMQRMLAGALVESADGVKAMVLAKIKRSDIMVALASEGVTLKDE